MRTKVAAKGILFTVATLTQSLSSTTALAAPTVIDCRFQDNFYFIVTIYEDGTTARIGVERDVGSKSEAFYDKLTGARFFIEYFADGTLPSTLTTILKDGTAVHSRHTLDVMGNMIASQMHGSCSESKN